MLKKYFFNLKNKKIWVAGHNGMVGRAIVRKLIQKKLNVLTVDKKNLDLKDKYNFYIVSIAIIVNFFPLVPSGNFFNNWISIISYYYIGIYIYSFRKVILK